MRRAYVFENFRWFGSDLTIRGWLLFGVFEQEVCRGTVLLGVDGWLFVTVQENPETVDGEVKLGVENVCRMKKDQCEFLARNT